MSMDYRFDCRRSYKLRMDSNLLTMTTQKSYLRTSDALCRYATRLRVFQTVEIKLRKIKQVPKKQRVYS